MGVDNVARVLPDYAEFDDAIGLDWYAVDPNLRQLLDRLLPDAGDRAFADEHVGRFGVLCGGDVARHAEITDHHPPMLVGRDRWGYEVGEIEHHPTWTETKADLVRAGFVGLPAHAGRPVPAVVTASHRLPREPGRDRGVLRARHDRRARPTSWAGTRPTAVRDEIVARLQSLDPDEAWEGGMFLTERQGGSDVGANTTRAVRDGNEWRLHGEKHFCSNVDAEIFIVLGTARRRARRPRRAGDVHRAAAARRRHAQRVPHPAAEAEARDARRADRRGVARRSGRMVGVACSHASERSRWSSRRPPRERAAVASAG